jgi:predicted nucleic acid-binding Zn ribbon protein
MAGKKRDPVGIKNLVWDVLRKKGYETPVKEQWVLQQWGKIVGEKIAENTHPARFENGCLFVESSNASWRNELTFLKQEIIKKINDFTGKKVVQDIIFTRSKLEIKSQDNLDTQSTHL